MKSSAYQTNLNTQSPAILQRIRTGDETVVEDCIDTYENLISALARKYTGSLKEAETATEQIFLDVWRYAGHYNSTKSDEEDFIYLIAVRD